MQRVLVTVGAPARAEFHAYVGAPGWPSYARPMGAERTRELVAHLTGLLHSTNIFVSPVHVHALEYNEFTDTVVQYDRDGVPVHESTPWVRYEVGRRVQHPDMAGYVQATRATGHAQADRLWLRWTAGAHPQLGIDVAGGMYIEF